MPRGERIRPFQGCAMETGGANMSLVDFESQPSVCSNSAALLILWGSFPSQTII